MTFMLPFVLDGSDREIPAGEYQLETDEELIEGLSFPAYRRVATRLYLHPKPGVTEMLAVSWADIAAAHLRDEIAVRNDDSVGSGQRGDAPVLKSFANSNSQPSQFCSSSLDTITQPIAARKGRQMNIWHPAAVSAVLVAGLAVCAWFIPPKSERTQRADRNVSLSGSTYAQLQSWSKLYENGSGQALSVRQLIERLANDWEKSNPLPAKPAKASDYRTPGMGRSTGRI